MELALAGFMQLDAAVLAPFTATLEQLHEEPKTVRLGMFLTGVLRELMDALPVGELEVVPRRRWVDLWTRGMVAATGLPQPLKTEQASGDFYPLGCDLRHHPNAVSAVIYGVYSPSKGKNRLARMTLNSYKVDVVAGADLWTAIDEVYSPAITALASQKVLQIKDMELRATGDLIFNGKATVGASFDMMALAKKHFEPGAKETLAQPTLDPLVEREPRAGEDEHEQREHRDPRKRRSCPAQRTAGIPRGRCAVAQACHHGFGHVRTWSRSAHRRASSASRANWASSAITWRIC